MAVNSGILAIADTTICSFFAQLSGYIFPEGYQGDIPQTGVAALMVVENLNVFPYYLDGFIPVIKTIVSFFSVYYKFFIEVLS